MSEGQPTLLFARPSGERRGGDRRARALYHRFDPLFAATLVNQIAPPEAATPGAYPVSRGPRAGIAFNVQA